jgi:membrane dipeptidase
MRRNIFLKSLFVQLVLSVLYSGLFSQSYIRLHEKAILIDTHNDVLSSASMKGLDFTSDLKGKTYSDLDRLRKGGVDVQVFAIFCNETFGKGTAFSYANREIDSLYAIVSRSRDKMMMVNDLSSIKKAVKLKKLGAMMGVEGGHMIEDDLSKLDSFYKRGVRYMTLTLNNSTSWASSARDETLHPDSQHNGLNDFGRQVVARMNELGMLVDLSHVGEKTFYDAISVSKKPVLVSHSCVYALCHHFRNLKDEQIRAVAKNGGVIDINFYSGFVDSNFVHKMADMRKAHQSQVDSLLRVKWPEYSISEWLTARYPVEAASLRPTIQQLADHIDYVAKMVGVDYVGIGSDFDGIESSPRELDDVTCYPLITKELVSRGYTANEIKKILGGNFIRVFKANQP